MDLTGILRLLGTMEPAGSRRRIAMAIKCSCAPEVRQQDAALLQSDALTWLLPPIPASTRLNWRTTRGPEVGSGTGMHGPNEMSTRAERQIGVVRTASVAGASLDLRQVSPWSAVATCVAMSIEHLMSSH